MSDDRPAITVAFEPTHERNVLVWLAAKVRNLWRRL